MGPLGFGQGQREFDGRSQAGFARGREVRGQGNTSAVVRRFTGQREHPVVIEDEERGTVRGDGFTLAPVPHSAQDGHLQPAETGASLEAPRISIAVRRRRAAIGDQAGAGFGVPIQPAEAFEFGAQQVHERAQMAGVIAG
ncbi:MAG: hypothetical protein HC809_15735, partial [Gammaproteobacteria bacterium]|nr:hypothetical protein [Gammaproteobacteria bacterium]